MYWKYVPTSTSKELILYNHFPIGLFNPDIDLYALRPNSNERYTFRSSFHRITDNISCSTFDGARFLFVTQIFRNTELNHSKWQIKIPTVSRNSGRTSLSQVIWKCFVKMIWLKCFLSNWKEDKDHPTIFARSIYPVIYVQNTTSWKSYV